MDIILKFGSIFFVSLIILKATYDSICLIYPTHRQLFFRFYSGSVSYLGYLTRFRNPEILQKHRASIRAYSQLFLLFIFNRLSIACAAAILLSLTHDSPLNIAEYFREIWARWDTRHYLHIAEHWYPREGSEVVILVFYPMFPLLIKLVNYLVGDYFLSGMLVSNVCFLLSLFLLYRLALLEFASRTIAFHSCALMLVFPISYFTSIAYTEGTFLLFSIACFYCIRREHWLLAGLFGMGAALTRNQGLILFAPMLYELLRSHIVQFRRGESFTRFDLVSRYATALLIPMGTLIYLWINKDISGDWFKFLEYQKNHWSQTAILFTDNIVNIRQRLDFNNPGMTIGSWLPSMFTYVSFLILIVVAAFKLPTAYTIYAITFFIISYSPSWLLSGPRYVYVLFPVYMALASLIHDRVAARILIYNILSLFTGVMLLAFIKNTVY